MNHTPAPWQTVCEDTINGKPAVFRIDAHGGTVALVNTIGIADARLIAAAPDLLAALQWALDQIEDSLDPDHQDALAAAHDAVSRATGED